MNEHLDAVRKAADSAALATDERNLAIRRAHEEGVSIRVIAEAAGLSPTRIHQIVRSQVKPVPLQVAAPAAANRRLRTGGERS
jgi:uncharacterized protein YggE